MLQRTLHHSSVFSFQEPPAANAPRESSVVKISSLQQMDCADLYLFYALHNRWYVRRPASLMRSTILQGMQLHGEPHRDLLQYHPLTSGRLPTSHRCSILLLAAVFLAVDLCGPQESTRSCGRHVGPKRFFLRLLVHQTFITVSGCLISTFEMSH